MHVLVLKLVTPNSSNRLSKSVETYTQINPIGREGFIEKIYFKYCVLLYCAYNLSHISFLLTSYSCWWVQWVPLVEGATASQGDLLDISTLSP